MDDTERWQRKTLLRALYGAFIGYGDPWTAYRDLGGTVGEREVEAHIYGLFSLPTPERDLLAEAANGLVDALPSLPRAAYSNEPRPAPEPGTSPSSPE